jgi:hypothetical protein
LEETMLETIIIAIVVVVAAILIYAATKPNEFEVSRTTSVQALPDKIFPLVNDLRSHSSWSPFDKGKEMKRVYSGPAAGKGAALEFEGDRNVGARRLAITDAAVPSKITMLLDMIKPFKAHNTVEFTFVPKGSATTVTWAMHGKQPYLGKLISTFINCDKMVGGQFEKGLADLKSVAEK